MEAPAPGDAALPPLLIAYEKHIQHLEQQNEQLKQELGRAFEDQNQLARQLEEARAQLQQLTLETDRARQQVGSAMQDQLRARQLEQELRSLREERQSQLQELRSDLQASLETTNRTNIDLRQALEKERERAQRLQQEAETSKNESQLLKGHVAALKEKESAFARRFQECREDFEKLRMEKLTAAKAVEDARTAQQVAEAGQGEMTRRWREQQQECEELQRQLRQQQRELDEFKQVVCERQQGELEAMRKLSECVEQLEHSKIDASNCLLRESRKDQALEALREQMRQAVLLQSENHQKYLKVVTGRHRSHIEELKEELRARDATESRLKAELERAQWERRQRELEVTALQRQLAASGLGGIANLAGPMGPSSPAVAVAVGDFAAGLGSEHAASHVSELQFKLQEAHRERDEFERQLQQERQKARREERSREADLELLRAQVAERDRRTSKADAELSALRDEVQSLQREVDRKQKEAQQARLERDDAERRTELQVAEACRDANTREERIKLKLEEAQARLKQLEQQQERQALQRQEREQKQRADRAAEKTRWEGETAEIREERDILDRRLREVQIQLSQQQLGLAEREKEAEALAFRNEQLALAIEDFKEQSSASTDKITQLITREAQLRTQIKDSQLQLERERLERERCEKDRDRLRLEIQNFRLAKKAAVLDPFGGFGGGLFAGASGPVGSSASAFDNALKPSKKPKAHRSSSARHAISDFSS